MIDIKEMTLKYPSGKGVFDLDFSVKDIKKDIEIVDSFGFVNIIT